MQARLHTAALAAVTSLLMLAGSAAAQPGTVGGQLLNPLWTTPDQNEFPTDFSGVAPDYADQSGALPWGPSGIAEPGPHSFDPAARRIHIRNAFSPTRFKLLWLRLQWNPGSAPPPELQPVGQPINEALWPSATALDQEGNPTGAGALTGVAWDTSPLGITVVTMTFRFVPQPWRESINLAPLVTANSLPFRVDVQTICIPSPAAATLLVGCGLVAARRRRT